MTESIPERSAARLSRLLLEGFTIVVSILLAFAVDAWWDTAREGRAARRQLEGLTSEMEANRRVLDANVRRGNEALEALRELIRLVSPEPPAISADSVAALFSSGFSPGGTELGVGATTTLLSTAEVSSVMPRLHELLVEFRTEAERYSRNGEQFGVAQQRLIAYLAEVSPAGFVSATTGVHDPTDFPVPVRRLLSDPQIEGLVGALAIRVRQLNVRASTLLTRADSIRAFLVAEGAS